ncbi:MAG: plsC 2 [Planctomycetota bacterium]|nr:plsC 2 [Planctomycetota bacterium]
MTAPGVSDPQSASRPAAPAGRDRSAGKMLWYRLVQHVVAQVVSVFGGIRATGRENIPETGGAILVSNHLSHLDVFVLGILLHRPLNYVARSTLFLPGLGLFIRSVGGFPIQRDGKGSEGFKETLRRVRNGGIVTFFPEGTRSSDGGISDLKPGIVALASRAGVPIIPAAIAGTYESWPKSRSLPRPHPIRVHYGRPIYPEELAGLSPEATTAVIRERMLESQRRAQAGLRGDLGE